MKSLFLTDPNATIKVEYQVDIVNSDQLNFTVMKINGLSDDEIHRGFDFRNLPSNMIAFKAFAQKNGLKLTMLDQNGSTVVADYTNIYYNGGLGIDNI